MTRARSFPSSARPVLALASALTLLLLCGAGVAQAESEYSRDGVYLQLSGIFGADRFKDDLNDAAQDLLGPTGRATVDGEFGISGILGYRFHPWVGAELEAEWIADFDTELQMGGTRIAKGKVKPVTFTGNARIYPMHGRLQPYALLGVGFMSADIETNLAGFDDEGATEFALRVGGGVEGYLTEHWGGEIGVDWVKPFGDIEEIDYISIAIGVKYRF